VHDFPSLSPRFEFWDPDGEDLPPPWSQECPEGAPYTESVVFSPDEASLLLPYFDGDLLEVSLATGKGVRAWKAHAGVVTSIDARHQDGVLVTGGRDGTIAVWASPYGRRAPLPADASSVQGFVQRFREVRPFTPESQLELAEPPEPPDEE
jgi:WD40 repeat protein